MRLLPVIIQCPHCENRMRHTQVASYNTAGARYYTDGYVSGQFVPHIQPLAKCNLCSRYFWTNDAKTDMDPRETNATSVADMDFDDWCEAATQPDLLDRELTVRMRIWHEYNHSLWKTLQDKGCDTIRTQRFTGNARRLLQMTWTDTDRDWETLLRAELHRELGEFGEAIRLLESRPMPEKYATRRQIILEAAAAHDVRVWDSKSWEEEKLLQRAAADLEAFHALCAEKQYEQARALAEPYAGKDMPEYVYQLGRLYDKGLGVAPDFAKAAELYRAAAENGHCEAANSIGNMLQFGEGVKQNFETALEWYDIAIGKGSIKAKYNVGMMLLTGSGVQKCFNMGLEWLRQSAEQGFAMAQYVYGSLYYEGGEIPKDLEKAQYWLLKAAKQNNPEALHLLGDMYADEGNAEKAFEMYQQAAEQDYTPAVSSLGVCYLQGKGVEQDLREAYRWLSKAAENGHPYASEILDRMEDDDGRYDGEI